MKTLVLAVILAELALVPLSRYVHASTGTHYAAFVAFAVVPFLLWMPGHIYRQRRLRQRSRSRQPRQPSRRGREPYTYTSGRR